MATDINAIAGAATGGESKTSTAASRLAGDFDNFLLLLTTQLKNQDPTEPLDTNDFTQQIAALSSVEQGINTNKNLEALISLIGNAQISSVVNYIGKIVDAEGDKGTLIEQQALFVYNLDKAADKVKVTLTDASGSVVFSGNGSKLAGRNQVVWDGINSNTGAQMPDGIYTIKVEATDAAGNAIKSQTLTTGMVTAVDIVDGAATLSVGTIPITLDKVLSIREVPAGA